MIAATLHKPEHGSLRLGAHPLRSLGLLAFVLVLLTTADISLVKLNVIIEFNAVILPVEGTNLMQQIPRRFLSYLDILFAI